MYTIAGVTGRVGSATAERLLEEGAPVRVIVRDLAKAQPWVERGADVAVVDLGDRAGLTAAIADSDGFFTLLPFDPATTDVHRGTRALVSSISGAVADRGVPHVAMLSAAGQICWPAPDHRRWSARPRRGSPLDRDGGLGGSPRALPRESPTCSTRPLGIYPVFAELADRPEPRPSRPATSSPRGPGAAGPATAQRGDRPRLAGLHRAAGGRDPRPRPQSQLEVVTIPKPGWGAASPRRLLPQPRRRPGRSLRRRRARPPRPAWRPHRALRHRPRDDARPTARRHCLTQKLADCVGDLPVVVDPTGDQLLGEERVSFGSGEDPIETEPAARVRRPRIPQSCSDCWSRSSGRSAIRVARPAHSSSVSMRRLE